MMYNIKKCTLNDLRQEWLYDISSRTTIFGVFLSGEPIGYGNIVEDYYDNKKVSWCGGCFIHEAHRGKGLQKKLIDLRISLAKKLGRDKMITCHVIGNNFSRKNLLSFGFVDTYQAGGCQYMELPLKPNF